MDFTTEGTNYGIYLSRENAHKGMFKEQYERFIAKASFDGIFISNDMSDKNTRLMMESEFMRKINIYYEYEWLTSCVMLLFSKNKKIEEQEKKLQSELLERQLKRKAVFDKHEAVLKLACDDKKGKQMRWRRHFYSYVKMLSSKVFISDDEEYELVGKMDRLPYNDSDMMQKAYTKKDPMRDVFLDIVTECGCFDY